MKRNLVKILRPSTANSSFDLHELSGDKHSVEYGLLTCPDSGESRYILAGFPLFTETASASSKVNMQMLQAVESELFGDAGQYQHFVTEKWRRPNRDAYAAFQPFNESTRALYSMVPLLRAQLRPGDYILDTWCRTGWSGELLAALFPAQNIVSIWEGNHGALGYRAFRHWLPEVARASNLDILFHDMNQPLPFKSGSFAAVIGLDTLHRYDADNVAGECQRVCRDDAPILFPHVHLTNSEPEPWFERGCRQEHGSFWNDYLKAASAHTKRSVYVESEMSLFSASTGQVISSTPYTSHYNAFIALLPQHWIGEPLGSINNHFTISDSSYLVANPLLDIDLNHLRIGLREDDPDGMTEHILHRHPGYRKYLEQRLCRELDPEQAQVIYWASRVTPLGDIAGRLGETTDYVKNLLDPLIAADVILPLPISSGMARLNNYFANQSIATPAANQNLASLWQDTVRNYSDNIYVASLEDDFELTYAELDILVQIAAQRLQAEIDQPGQPMCVAARPNIETVILFWAAQLSACPFVAIDPAWPIARIAEIIQRYSFRLLFTDIEIPAQYDMPANTEVIVFETAVSDDSQFTGFEEWLETDNLAELPEQTPLPGSTSVILFTSGTTGQPKGVQLAHEALWRSARTFSQHYAWKEEDAYLSLGNFATMSGLRNPLIVSATVGCKFLIPDSAQQSGILEAISIMGSNKATIMGVVPAFIHRLAALSERLDSSAFGNLRYFLCTAANLDSAEAGLVEDRLGVPVYNYYGLTETCGACIFMATSARGNTANLLGLPEDAIAQIVTEDGELARDGRQGELRIYSGNLMIGYLEDPARSCDMMRGGWLYTGDICRWSPGGVIELLGRKKDAIKAASGTLIYVGEVELHLNRATDLGELTVAGFVDDRGDEKMACFLRTSIGPGEEVTLANLNELLRTTLGHDYQLAHLIFVETFPRSANQKIRKQELLQMHGLEKIGSSSGD